MRLATLLGVGMAFALIAADRAPEKVADVPKDLEKLQGAWTVTKMEVGGKEEKEPVGSTFTVTGEKYTIKDKDGKEMYSGTLKADWSKKPATLDMTMKGPDGKEVTMPCLISLDGDMLKCCMPTMPGKDRPKEISAKDDTRMVTLKKEKK